MHHFQQKRRKLLWSGLSACGLSAISQLGWSAGNLEGKSPRLLFVFLRGACDTDSVLFQADNAFYHDARPSIGIGRPGLGDNLLEVAPGWALHPAMSAISPLIEQKQWAFVPFSGSGDNSRSHFKAQDIMEQGTGLNNKEGSDQGLLNRILLELQGAAKNKAPIGGIFTGSANPLICRGKADMNHVDLSQKKSGNVELDNRQLQALKRLYANPETSEKVTLAAKRKEEVNTTLMNAREAMEMEHGADVRTPNNLTQHFEALASLMKQGGLFSVGFTEIGGWDTHINQGNDVGQLANKLRDLSNAVAAYASNMGSAWQQTQVVILSEFGRTFRENGNKGTDHGHGTTLMLASGAGFANPLLGNSLTIARDTLHEGRDQPVLNEYRSVLARFILPRAGLEQSAIQRCLQI
jgi:uncharacterized protein (DUF1501 family)